MPCMSSIASVWINVTASRFYFRNKTHKINCSICFYYERIKFEWKREEEIFLFLGFLHPENTTSARLDFFNVSLNLCG